jgi:hypothetical protein
MAARTRLLICSDIHYASDAEKRRGHYELAVIKHPLQRLFVRFYRRYFWLRDPFAHNALLEHVLDFPQEPDLVIANGDYSCDSEFIGVADPAARASAGECLDRLRRRFGPRFRAVFGDHELGKTSIFGGRGGLRLESYRVAQQELGLEPLWSERCGRYVLIGLTSTLIALPVYSREALPEERASWQEIARDHVRKVEDCFGQLGPEDKVLLFCHDPTALPFLWQIESVRRRIAQVERTIIGHLHSDIILRQSLLLSWLPPIASCGTTVARLSTALSRAREWSPFNILLCPSLSGLELTQRGGFYTGEIDESGQSPAQFRLHVVRRGSGPARHITAESCP